MSVEIDPVELGFHRPFTAEVSQILKIRNTNHTPVAFKVKTTAPKQYCVRPNSGRIEPGKEVEVTVLLQAMKQEPPADAKCRDKFLVQSVAVTAEKEFTNISQIWQHVDEAEKSTVQEKKIRVVYLPQAGSNVGGAAVTPMKNGIVNGTSHETPETAPPAYSSQRSPSPEATYTPETRRSTIGPSSTSKSVDEDSRSIPENKSTVSAIAAATPQSMEELKVALAEAKATIASYTNEAGLRARKVVKGETSNETVNNLAQQVQQAAPNGVPPQIVAALCFISFMLAYLLF